MFFRSCEKSNIETVKIVEFYNTEVLYPNEPKNYDPNERFRLEITMKDGSIQHERLTKHFAVQKYNEFFNNMNDVNYKHNYKMIHEQQYDFEHRHPEYKSK